MKRFKTFVCVTLLALASVSFAQDGTLPRFEPLDSCFIEIPEGVNFECGHVIVPEFHTKDTNGTVSIGVVRLLSPSDSSAEPLFHMAGGPGGSIIESAAADAGIIVEDSSSYDAQILANHDLVYVEQRGAKFSEPFLSCGPEYMADYLTIATSGGAPEESTKALYNGLKACYDGYVANGVDISAYNSLEMAADINAVREVFGYDKINYLGESYSTLLGQHIMREYPDILNAVILDGVINITNTSWEQRIAERVQGSLDTLVTRCQNDESCSTAYPTFAEDLNLAKEKLDQEPFMVDLQGFQIQVDSTIFAYAISNALYGGGGNIPLAVHGYLNDFSNDRADALSRNFFFLTTLFSADEISLIQHYGTVCAEDPPTQEDMSTEETAFSFVEKQATFDVSGYLEMCPYINPPALPDGTDDLMTSDIPVLLLHGSLDPVTPRFLVEPIREGLTTSYSFEFPNTGHIQFAAKLECAQNIVTQFLTDPMTEPDSSCIAEVPPVAFELPQE